MTTMKKAFSLIMSILMILTAFTACGDSTDKNEDKEKDEIGINEDRDDDGEGADKNNTDTADKEDAEPELVTAWVVTKWNDTEFIYDDNWCRIGQRSPSYTTGAIETLYYPDVEFDENGFLISEYDGGGVAVEEKYNEYGDMILFNVNRGKQVHTYDYSYDENGNILTMIETEDSDWENQNFLNTITLYEYNENGEKIREINISHYSKYKTEYEYTNGLLTCETVYYIEDALLDGYSFHRKTEFSYDEKGRVVKEKYYNSSNILTSENDYVYQDHEDGSYSIDNGYQTTTYDKHGNLISRKNNNSDTIDITVTYAEVQVTPIRAKAIARDYRHISFYRLQK